MKRNGKHAALLLFFVFSLSWQFGCGGGMMAHNTAEEGTGNASGSIPPNISITVSPAMITIAPCAAQQFTAVINNGSDQRVNWSLSPGQGATQLGLIDSNGLYTAPCNITARETVSVDVVSVAYNLPQVSAIVTIDPGLSPPSPSPPPPPTQPPSCAQITITPGIVTLTPGETQQFDANISCISNQAVIWTASPGQQTTDVGSLNGATGFYQAPPENMTQTVVITATSVQYPSLFRQAIVTVNPGTGSGGNPPPPPSPAPPPFASITINPSMASVKPNETVQFSAVINNVNPTDNQAVTWSLQPGQQTTLVGTIDPATGFYTAPDASAISQVPTATIQVIATSVEFPTISARAFVTVSANAP